MGTRFEQIFTKGDKWPANGHIKICLASPVMMDMQIRTSMRHYYTQIRHITTSKID